MPICEYSLVYIVPSERCINSLFPWNYNILAAIPGFKRVPLRPCGYISKKTSRSMIHELRYRINSNFPRRYTLTCCIVIYFRIDRAVALIPCKSHQFGYEVHRESWQNWKTSVVGYPKADRKHGMKNGIAPYRESLEKKAFCIPFIVNPFNKCRPGRMQRSAVREYTTGLGPRGGWGTCDFRPANNCSMIDFSFK